MTGKIDDMHMFILKELVADSERVLADGVRLAKILSSGYDLLVGIDEKKENLSRAISESMYSAVPANRCIMLGCLDMMYIKCHDRLPEGVSFTYSEVYEAIASDMISKTKALHEQITSINALLNDSEDEGFAWLRWFLAIAAFLGGEVHADHAATGTFMLPWYRCGGSW